MNKKSSFFKTVGILLVLALAVGIYFVSRLKLQADVRKAVQDPIGWDGKNFSSLDSGIRLALEDCPNVIGNKRIERIYINNVTWVGGNACADEITVIYGEIKNGIFHPQMLRRGLYTTWLPIEL